MVVALLIYTVCSLIGLFLVVYWENQQRSRDAENMVNRKIDDELSEDVIRADATTSNPNGNGKNSQATQLDIINQHTAIIFILGILSLLIWLGLVY